MHDFHKMESTKCNNKKDRPTFLLNDSKSKPLRAGGVLFYKLTEDDIEFLVIDKDDRYEDLGGKTDVGDSDIYRTVSREVFEESNGKFQEKNIRDRLISNDKYVYKSSSKYINFLLEVTKEESMLETVDFGTKETYCNMTREIRWIKFDMFFGHTLHPRLDRRRLLDVLGQIMREKIITEYGLSDVIDRLKIS